MEDIELAVQRSIQDGDMEGFLKHLSGRRMDQRFTSGWTCLLHACINGKYIMVKYLLEHDANANCDHELFTPLMAVCNSSSSDEEQLANCARVLVKFNADVNAMDKFKNTPLMLACSKGHELVVSVLLNTKCDINKIDNEGCSALHMACMYGHRNIVPMLLDHGAIKNLKDRRGRLASSIANDKGLDDVVQMLEDPIVRDANQSESHVYVYERKKTSFEELLTVLPCFYNSSGKEGFHDDVKILLSSMRLEHKADVFLNNKVSLSQYLNMKNDKLKELGILFSGHRDKIITGNKRFVLHPWGASSLPHLDQHNSHSVDMMFLVRLLANSVKHLHILWASTLYCNERIVLSSEDDKVENLYQITMQTYRQTVALIKVLKTVQQQVTHQEMVDKCQPADLILPKKPTQYITAGRIVFVSAVFAFGLWKSNIISLFRK